MTTSQGTDALITGLGVVAPNGVGRAAFAEALAAGRGGIGEIVSFDSSDTGRERAAEIAGFDPAPFLRSPKNYLDRHSALAFAAAEMAVRESGRTLPLPGAEQGRGGLAVGGMAGNVESLAAFHAKLVEKGPKFAPPFLFPHTYYNTTAGLLSIEYGLGGPHGQFCGGAAGLEAVRFAAEGVRLGRAEMFLAGGAEAFGEWSFRAALARGALSPLDGGVECARPFGLGRNGAIAGEGAAFFVMETAETVRARDGRTVARVCGAALAASPADAMRAAMEDAHLASVDAIFAAAGGYVEEDEEEARAILGLTGGSGAPVVALKGLIGESFGASGALNLAAALVSMRQGVLPPSPAAECAFHGLSLVHAARRLPIRAALVNAGGAGEWVSMVVAR